MSKLSESIPPDLAQEAVNQFDALIKKHGTAETRLAALALSSKVAARIWKGKIPPKASQQFGYVLSALLTFGCQAANLDYVAVCKLADDMRSGIIPLAVEMTEREHAADTGK